MFKRIIDWLFGAKLPCGHGRMRSKLREHKTCKRCGNVYFRARFIYNEPRYAGEMVFRDDLEEGKPK